MVIIPEIRNSESLHLPKRRTFICVPRNHCMELSFKGIKQLSLCSFLQKEFEIRSTEQLRRLINNCGVFNIFHLNQ